MQRLARFGCWIAGIALGWLMVGVPLQAAVPSLQQYLEANGFIAVAFDTTASNTFYRLDTLVNGRTVRFMVDTGSYATVLATAQAAGIKTLGELHQTLPDGFGHLITNPGLLSIDSWQIGPIILTHQPAAKHDLVEDYVKQGFEGLIGLDFLERHNCLIDCGAQKLYLRESPLNLEQLAAVKRSLAKSGFSTVRIRRGARLQVESKINQKPLNWMIDTGAGHTIIDKRGESQVGLFPVAEAENPHVMELHGFQGIGLGNKSFHVLKLDKLEIGARTWRELYVVGSDVQLDHGDPNEASLQIHGLLGQEQLTKSGALIDARDGVLWFRSVGN